MKMIFGALAIALALQGAALAQMTAAPSPQASGTMQGGGAVPLIPAGKKGPAGSAVLSQQGANLLVTLHLPAGYTAGKAAIYSGTCKSSGAAAMSTGTSYALTVTQTSGPSMTTLKNLSLDMLTSSPHVIVVQGTPALCGDMSSLLPPQKP
jgi:hypothetical protein